MTVAAPRIDPRLVAELARLDDPHRPIAETHRRLGVQAERLSLPRPSYEQTRVLVHSLRRGMSGRDAATLLLHIAMRVRPPEAVFELLE